MLVNALEEEGGAYTQVVAVGLAVVEGIDVKKAELICELDSDKFCNIKAQSEIDAQIETLQKCILAIIVNSCLHKAGSVESGLGREADVELGTCESEYAEDISNGEGEHCVDGN